MGRPQGSAEHHWLRGTKPKPNQRGEANQETDTPTVNAGRPKMPKTLSTLEVECWKGAAKIMKVRGTLSKGDAENLELFAVTKARWILARRDVESRGLSIIETRHAKDGSEYEVEVPNPSLKILDACETRLLAYSKVLGLSTMDRSKVKATRGSVQSIRPSPQPGTAWALAPHLFDERGRPLSSLKDRKGIYGLQTD